ncbi:HPr family phosphocarrier protein [Bacillus mesophilum]|uniref:HPr family phosphocarrier protein n=1 Tax=Bacillus mesophilum TaxID=1071718 RepID=A0A7V7RJM0_9BACI|nr:HPr family phosphocarrier protein [Bacillus mesophilum]KAB2331011.1 HPr family phosphocarrier protein [Bacillus mesophilum]
MNKIESASVIIKNKLSMKTILDLYQKSKSFNGTAFLYSGNKLTQVKNLPKLVSFLLTVTPGSIVKIIVEGSSSEKHLQSIAEICQQSHSKHSLKRNTSYNSIQI